MPSLVTLAQADAHLRLDGDLLGSPPADPARVQDVLLKLDQAEAIVIDYIGANPDILDGSPPAYIIGSPPTWSARDIKVIQSAVLLVLSALFDDDQERTLGAYMREPDGTIPLLLRRLRSPALA